MRQYSEDSDYYYVIQSKTDRKKFFKDFTDDGQIELTSDLGDAYTDGNSGRLFFMLEEYSARFKGRFEVAHVEIKKTITYKTSKAKKELEDWQDGQRQIAKRIVQGHYA